MAGFNKSINLDPTMVGGMSLDQKRECMSEIERRRTAAWKYSCVFSIVLMVYIFGYDLLSVMYSLKMMQKVPQISGFMYLVPIIVMIPSFFAHSMNGKWVLVTVLAYMFSAFGVIITASWLNAAAAPFLIAGAFIAYRVSSCCEMYEVLSKQEGFPEFYSFEHGTAMAKEIIERNAKPKEKELSPLTKAAIGLHNASKAVEETVETTETAEKMQEQKNIPEGEDADGE